MQFYDYDRQSENAGMRVLTEYNYEYLPLMLDIMQVKSEPSAKCLHNIVKHKHKVKQYFKYERNNL